MLKSRNRRGKGTQQRVCLLTFRVLNKLVFKTFMYLLSFPCSVYPVILIFKQKSALLQVRKKEICVKRSL